MGALAWVMMGLALWHFTVWLPDHYLGRHRRRLPRRADRRLPVRLLDQRLLGSRPPRHRSGDGARGDSRGADRDGHRLLRGPPARARRAVGDPRADLAPRSPSSASGIRRGRHIRCFADGASSSIADPNPPVAPGPGADLRAVQDAPGDLAAPVPRLEIPEYDLAAALALRARARCQPRVRAGAGAARVRRPAGRARRSCEPARPTTRPSSPGSKWPSTRSAAGSSPAGESSSTATTTSTASARRRSWSARCARWARTSGGFCRGASTTATGCRRKPCGGSPDATASCCSRSTAR